MLLPVLRLVVQWRIVMKSVESQSRKQGNRFSVASGCL
jgi:hypothetical protein